MKNAENADKLPSNNQKRKGWIFKSFDCEYLLLKDFSH